MAKSLCLALVGAALLLCSAYAQQQLANVGSDGNLDQCQVISGSYAAGDGTFDKDSDFQATINDGAWSASVSDIYNSTGDVLYVVPAARSANYAPLTLAERQQAGYCYDTLTLLPQYNPMAVIIPDNSNGTVTTIAVSPISTLLTFGWAYGLRDDSLHNALGLDPSIEISTYNGAEEFVNDPTFYKEGVKLQNMVTLGATLLSNSTDSYASFAVLMDQALGRAALNASNTCWNQHCNMTGALLNLNDQSTDEYIFFNAAQYVHASKDWLLPTQLNALGSPQYAAAGLAAGYLADVTDDATTQADVVKTLYYAQNTMAPQFEELADGSVTVEDFLAATSPSAISAGVAAITLPTAPAPTTAPSTSAFSRTDTQASTDSQSASSSDSGLSGGAIAGIVIGCIVGVALLALIAAMLVKRNANRAHTAPSSGPRRLWGRRDHDAINENAV